MHGLYTDFPRLDRESFKLGLVGFLLVCKFFLLVLELRVDAAVEFSAGIVLSDSVVSMDLSDSLVSSVRFLSDFLGSLVKTLSTFSAVSNSPVLSDSLGPFIGE